MDLKIPSSLKLFMPAGRKFVQIGQINKLEGQELEKYLSHFDAEEMRQVRELWKRIAARKELIDFEANG